MSGQETAFIQKNKGIISLFIDCGMRKMLQLSIIITRTGKRFSMDIGNLWSLQLMMFLLMAAGVVMAKRGVVKTENKGILTDLMLYLFLPCNIINSFRMQFEREILEKLSGLYLFKSINDFI